MSEPLTMPEVSRRGRLIGEIERRAVELVEDQTLWQRTGVLYAASAEGMNIHRKKYLKEAAVALRMLELIDELQRESNLRARAR